MTREHNGTLRKKHLRRRHTLYIKGAAASAVMLLPGCGTDIVDWASTDRGLLDCKALGVEYEADGKRTRTPGADGIDTGNFTVSFINENGKEEKSFRYSEMPEIVMLPVGRYTAVAKYGEDTPAGWNTPCYEGRSAEFEIRKNEISTVPGTVVCSLSNIKVKVSIEHYGSDIVGEDATVTVAVGEAGNTLSFDREHIHDTAYFRYSTGSGTITATFSGTVYGEHTTATYIYSNAAPGNCYSINFRVARPDELQITEL